MQSRRNFLKGLAVGAAGAIVGGCEFGGVFSGGGSLAEKPNILLIMIDDMGWMDLRCQGNERLNTPNIDQLASDGMLFTDAYAAAPVCSPTRASIMTGQSPARLGITNHLPDRPSFQPDNAVLRSAKVLDHLPLDHVTIAERLKEAGYATGFIGKWHLSGRRGKKGDGGPTEEQLRPQWQGFDLNIGGCSYGGPSTYFDPYRIPGIEPRRKGEYLPYRLADEAVGFMKAHRDEPFFLALWNYTVHWPMEAPEELIEKYKDKVGPGIKDARYAAMLEAMDKSMGQVLGAVDEMGLREKTLVIFTSDNGAYGGVSDIRPLRECKGFLYEGGIRVPMIARWPGRIKAGSICAVPVITTDLYPTMLDAAGVKAGDKVLDGESIVPLLKQTSGLKRKAIYFHYPNYAFHKSNRLGGAIREGDYKLLEWYDDGSVELYNLAEDISEKRDIAKKMPKKAAYLKRKLDAWLVESGANMPERI